MGVAAHAEKQIVADDERAQTHQEELAGCAAQPDLAVGSGSSLYGRLGLASTLRSAFVRLGYMNQLRLPM